MNKFWYKLDKNGFVVGMSLYKCEDYILLDECPNRESYKFDGKNWVKDNSKTLSEEKLIRIAEINDLLDKTVFALAKNDLVYSDRPDYQTRKEKIMQDRKALILELEELKLNKQEV